MSRLATSFVLAYHGCDASVAQDIVLDHKPMKASERDYDWLGPGIYFWESDPRRAWEWAEAKKERGDIETPAVVGAAIDLGHCLDLMNRDDLELLALAYDIFAADVQRAGLRMPENKNPPNASSDDKLIRKLDCAVIKQLHQIVEDPAETAFNIPPFDTVRGLFTEGEPIYPEAGFKCKTHIQIAVRKPESIKGAFLALKPAPAKS